MYRSELNRKDCGWLVRDRIAAVENRKECQTYTVNLLQKGLTLLGYSKSSTEGSDPFGLLNSNF